jgi:hypothetical protein
VGEWHGNVMRVRVAKPDEIVNSGSRITITLKINMVWSGATGMDTKGRNAT